MDKYYTFSTKAKHSLPIHDATYSIIYFRKEREANAQLGKQRFSKLLAPAEGAHNDNDDDNEEENESRQSEIDLSHPVKELCKTVDAFIYVVDSSADSQRGNLNKLIIKIIRISLKFKKGI